MANIFPVFKITTLVFTLNFKKGKINKILFLINEKYY